MSRWKSGSSRSTISYSTAPKSTAQDGDGGHSPFAAALAQRLHTPGVEVGLLFRQVRQDVYDATGHRQDPFISANLGPEPFYFVQPSIPAPAPAPVIRTGPTDWEVEQAVWTAAKDCQDYQGYLARYPSGAYSTLAKTHLTKCQSAPAKPIAGSTDVNRAVAACNAAAGSRFDLDRPTSSQFIDFERIDALSAISICQKALDLNPSDRSIVFNLGRAMSAAKNFTVAAKLYDESCNSGSLAGCNGLGVMYNYGQGLPLDYRKAKALYEQACDRGYAGACTNLGVLYTNGSGVAQDYAKAKALFQQACSGDDSNSCYNLGTFFEEGRGMTPDIVQARTWYIKSCKLGNKIACSRQGIR